MLYDKYSIKASTIKKCFHSIPSNNHNRIK